MGHGISTNQIPAVGILILPNPLRKGVYTLPAGRYPIVSRDKKGPRGGGLSVKSPRGNKWHLTPGEIARTGAYEAEPPHVDEAAA